MSGFGLVLGGGGLPGEAFHRGVLRALLDERGIDARSADVVVGTSAGSLVAASIRAPKAPPVPPIVESATAPQAQRLPPLPDLTALLGYARRPWRMRAGGLTAALLPPGRRSTRWLQEPLRRRFGVDWPASSTWIVAARRRTGRRVVFGRDRHDTDLATAVAASCAIPGYFRPVVVDGETYVDGAVHSATNADLLAGQELDLAVVSAPMGVHTRVPRPSITLPFRLAWHTQLAREVAAVRRSGTEVIAVEPSDELARMMGANPVDARRIDEIEDEAYDVVCRVLRRRAESAA